MKHIFALGGLIALVATTIFTTPTQAAPAERCFTETGFCISRSIRAYWEKNGGLPVFGYPIGPVQQETVEGTWTGPVQWFERDRLEDHGNEGKGILAGRLGAYRFGQIYGTDWQQLPPDGSKTANCRFFQQTLFNLCEPFLSYWQNNGGLERFGYPITRQRQETVEGKEYSVQYFERRRMEYHPENAGTPYAVLLGLLGNEVRSTGAANCAPLADKALNDNAAYYQGPMGCPSAKYDTRIAHQYLDGGEMIWVPATGRNPAKIYVITPNYDNGVITWSQFVDTYREGEAVGGNEPAPRGRYGPQRGFGKLWWNTPALREQLGWATGGETESQATILLYPQTDRLMMKRDTGTVDIFMQTGVYVQAAFAP